MELFNYESIGAFYKYSTAILWGCIAVSVILFIVGLIITFAGMRDDRWTSGFVKFIKGFFGTVISTAILVGGIWLSFSFRNTNVDTYEAYVDYKERYEAGDYLVAKGKVEEFTPATGHKSFTVDGVRFTIYSSLKALEYRDPEEKGGILYYTYKEAGYNMNYNAISETMDAVYKPEECVILGENQLLEIHYVQEYGQNRILYIKELSE